MVYAILTQPDTKFVQQIKVLNLDNTYLLDDFDKYCHLLASERSLLIKAFLACVTKNLILKKPNTSHAISLLINCLFHLTQKTKRIFLDLAVATIPDDINLMPFLDTIMKYSLSKYKFQLELLAHYMNNYILPELRKLEKVNHRTVHASALMSHVKKCIVHSDPIVRTLGKDIFLLLSKQEQVLLENQMNAVELKRLNILIKQPLLPQAPASAILAAIKQSPVPSNEKEINKLLYLLDTNQRIKTLKLLGQLPFHQLSEPILIKLYSKLVHVANISPTLIKIEQHLPNSTIIELLLKEKRWMRIKHVIKWDQVDIQMMKQWDIKVFQYINPTASEIKNEEILNFIKNVKEQGTTSPVAQKRTVPFTPKKNMDVKRTKVLEGKKEESALMEEDIFSKYLTKTDSKVDEKMVEETKKVEELPISEHLLEEKAEEDEKVNFVEETPVIAHEPSIILEEHPDVSMVESAIEQLLITEEASEEEAEIENQAKVIASLKKEFENVDAATVDVHTPKQTPINTPSRLKTPFNKSFDSPMMVDSPLPYVPIYDTFNDYVDMYYNQGNLAQFYLMLLQGSVPFSKSDFMDYFINNPKQLHIAALVDTIMPLMDGLYLKPCISLLTWAINQKKAILPELTFSILKTIGILYECLVFYN